LRQLMEPREVQLLELETERKEKVRGLAVERIEVNAGVGPAEHHEGANHLLRIAAKCMEKGNAVAHCARHHVLALDERSDQPGLVANEPQLVRQRRELLDDGGLSLGGELRDDVVGLEAYRELEHLPRRPVEFQSV